LDIASFREFCIGQRAATEGFPFGEDTLVFKVMGKMFALVSVKAFERVSLKVNPEAGAEFRERYPAVTAAYHMNKRHWITVRIDGSIPDRLLLEWTQNAYNLVVQGLTRRDKSALELL
jgi:predicted DNA-binding protein (MmcQ/YjbR family)